MEVSLGASDHKIYYEGQAEDEDTAIQRLLDYTGPLGVDTETISLRDRTGIGVGVSTLWGDAYYFQVLPHASGHLATLFKVLARAGQIKVYFNALFDLRVLRQISQDESLPAPDISNIADASLMAQIQGRESNQLDVLSQKYLGKTNPFDIKELLLAARDGKKGGNMLEVPFLEIAVKNAHDTRHTLELWERLSKKWPNQRNRECYEVDMKLIPILLAMEDKGLQLNSERVEEHYVELRTEVNTYVEICDQLGFSPSSPQQVGYILATRGNILPFTRGKRRQLRTDEETLESVKDPLAQLILRFRKINKLLGTYVVPFRGQNRGYTHFRIDLATGRLASGQFGEAHSHVCRNAQNIPGPMRDIYVPDNEVWSWMDFSQIEMRILAYLAHDSNMIAAFEQGLSIHEMTLAELWPGVKKKDSLGNDTWEYLTSKTFNFAMAYYAMDKTLAKHTKLPIEICSKYKAIWLHKLYPGCRDYMELRMADPSPYAETDFGRRMFLPDINEMRKRSEEAGNPFYEAGAQNHINKCKINYVIQGTGADIIKRAMLQVQDLDLRLQVHDELVVNGYSEFPEQLASIHPEIPTPFESHLDRVWR